MKTNSSRQSPGMQSIERLIERFKARLRMQRSVMGAVEGACLGLMIAGVGVAAMRTGWMEADSWWLWALVAVAFTMIAAALRAIQPVDAIAAAQIIDRSHGLHDRLSTAVSLAKSDDLSRADQEFVEAQLRDALRHVETIDPRKASPWRHPADTRLLAAVAISVIVVGLIPIPDHTEELPEPFTVQYNQVLDDTTLQLERDRLRELRRRISELPDEQAEQLADEIEALLDAVEAREISEREFLEAIDEIMERHFGDETEQKELDLLAEALADAAREIREEHAETLAEHPELEEVMDAFDEGDFQKAADALSEFADKLDSDDLTEEQAERLADLLEHFADHLDGQEERFEELFEEHRDKFEEMLSQMDDGSMERNQDLLDDARDAMEQAAQDKEEFSESAARRQLEQLSREIDETADEMRKSQAAESTEGAEGETQRPDHQDGDEGDDGEQQDGDPQGDPAPEERGPDGPDDGADDDEPDYRNEVGRKMDDASRQLQEMENQRQRSEQREEARRQLEEMRESMSRSDSSEDEQRGEQMRDFMDRARGEQGEEGEDSDSEGTEQQGASDGGGDEPSDDREHAEAGEDREGSDGEGAGHGGSAEETGEVADEMDAEYIREELRGQDSEEGRSRSEIIRSASEEGFATTDYQDVYADYHDIAEEVMEREAVPDGYRYYIKRYFQLIRPQQ